MLHAYHFSTGLVSLAGSTICHCKGGGTKEKLCEQVFPQISDVVISDVRFSSTGVQWGGGGGGAHAGKCFFSFHLYRGWVHSRCISGFKVSLLLFFE